MPAIKLNISLEEEVVRTLRRCASEDCKSTSRYLADLIRDDARRRQDALAAEGYRLLSADTASFAAAAWPLACETWPEWEQEAGCAGREGVGSDEGSANGEPEAAAR
jgi:hypothetical protein